MAVLMPCKAWPIKLYPALHLSPVKCTVKPKAAGFTRIRVSEVPNVGMMQVKPAPKDFSKCKNQMFISLKNSLDTCPVSQEKIGKFGNTHLSHGKSDGSFVVGNGPRWALPK
jgi:hypothetical protein